MEEAGESENNKGLSEEPDKEDSCGCLLCGEGGSSWDWDENWSLWTSARNVIPG